MYTCEKKGWYRVDEYPEFIGTEGADVVEYLKKDYSAYIYELTDTLRQCHDVDEFIASVLATGETPVSIDELEYDLSTYLDGATIFGSGGYEFMWCEVGDEIEGD